MQNIFKKSAAVMIALAVNAAFAEPVDSKTAETAARQWLANDAALGCELDPEVAGVRTCWPVKDVSIHVVELKDGGFVVMSSDTTREPVVAFSSGGKLEESDSNPLWVLLKRDSEVRTGGTTSASTSGTRAKAASSEDSVSSQNEARWKRLLGGNMKSRDGGEGISEISDVRVEPLVQSKWYQAGWEEDSLIYNYYTPNHYLCGCVATAGAQVMRYFEWPRATTYIQPFTNPHCKVDGVKTPLTSQGGYYDWSKMPLVPDDSITDEERQMIGKLTSDIGICVGMKYTSTESGVSLPMLVEAFKNHFRYADALPAQWENDVSNSDDVKNAILSNLDASLPVVIGIQGMQQDKAIGHSVVGDGYGYSDDSLYLHINMGWGGHCDAWYAPPRLAAGYYNFNVLSGFVCNIFTNKTDSGSVICSGRVLDKDGEPIENSVVTAKRNGEKIANAVTNAKGIYSLVLPPGSYVLSAADGDFSATTSVTLPANVGSQFFANISDDNMYGITLIIPTSDTISNTISIGNRTGVDMTMIKSESMSVDEPIFTPYSCMFYPSTNIEITCKTEGATIRYTLDGTDPTEKSDVYTAPICVDGNATVKAKAWKDGTNPSAIVSAIYTYATPGDYFSEPIEIDGSSGKWTIDDISEFSVETGEPKHIVYRKDGRTVYYDPYHTVWYKWTAPDSGDMTFETWAPIDGDPYYGTFIAVYSGDDLSSAKQIKCTREEDIDDDSGVTSLSFPVEQGETYRIVGMSCAPANPPAKFILLWHIDLETKAETSTTEVPVEYKWLEEYFPGDYVRKFESIANTDYDDDKIDTWVEYVLGTDPTNIMSRLEAYIRMDGGKPVVESNINTNRLDGFGYRLVTKGKPSLDKETDWSEADDSEHKFFMLSVEPK